MLLDRCKQAECDRLKEDIMTLRMELSFLQRRKSVSQGSLSPTSIPSNPFPSNQSSMVPNTSHSTPGPNTNPPSMVQSQSSIVPSNLPTMESVTSPETRDPGNGLGITGLGAQGKGNGTSLDVQIGSVDQGSGPGTSAGHSSSLEVQMGSIEVGQTTTSISGQGMTESIDPDSQEKK